MVPPDYRTHTNKLERHHGAASINSTSRIHCIFHVGVPGRRFSPRIRPRGFIPSRRWCQRAACACQNQRKQPYRGTSNRAAVACGALSCRESEICLSALHDMGEHPLLWDEFCPNLYRMTLSVYCIQDGVLRSAERCEDFGMRSFTVGEHDGGRQFFINGRPPFCAVKLTAQSFRARVTRPQT